LPNLDVVIVGTRITGGYSAVALTKSDTRLAVINYLQTLSSVADGFFLTFSNIRRLGGFCMEYQHINREWMSIG